MEEGTAKASPEKVRRVVVGDKGKQLVVYNSGIRAEAKEGKDSKANDNNYPKPLAKYWDVVVDRALFMETLEKLHATMGTRFMVPTVGGKKLDLHRLFVEVTSRGGIERVIGERRWREVIAVFHFPSTTTNASFILRKYYMTLIHRYEQIYFFELGRQSSPPPTVSLDAPSVMTSPSKRLLESTLACSGKLSASQRQRKSNDDFSSSGISLPINSRVVGVIDEKCELGYIVTVTVGTTKLKGLIYHPLHQAAGQAAEHLDNTNNSSAGVTRRQQRRKKQSKRDPTHPKPNRSGYNFFFGEQQAKLKSLRQGKDREISKVIGELWNKLSEAEKAVYQERGLKDRERYRSEMEVYKQKQHAGQVVSNAVPIQQHPAEPKVVMGDENSKVKMDEENLPLSDQNDSSSDGSDSEGKRSDATSELETSQENAETATESSGLAADLSTGRSAYELRRRDEGKVNNEHDLPIPSECVVKEGRCI